MRENTYALGLDFGSLSGRALLVEVATGREVASAALDYPHQVMETALPDGVPLGNDWALQHPSDYLEVLYRTIPEVLEKAGVPGERVVGVGVDFTSCTILPVRGDGVPLCLLPEYQGEPHAYVKLWKHHAAQPQADRINALAAETRQPWLGRYGGRVSCESALPKLLELWEQAPKLAAETELFVEAGDWVVWQLTGRLTRNACAAGYKSLWDPRGGFPGKEFLERFSPGFGELFYRVLAGDVSPLGSRAGGVTPEMAGRTGLRPGTPVAVANVDAHVTVPALGIAGPGRMLSIIGTSTCHMLVGEREIPLPGISGVAEEGILPGFYGYEAGQSCVGDGFAWFARTQVPGEYQREAEQEQIGVQELLTQKAARLRPGESGLLALDWWNGNRSVLSDMDLSGLVLGLTLRTKPEELYRAMLESTAYGARVILENFRRGGLPVEEFCASGGIAKKNPLMMQIYADVTGLPVRVGATSQGPALGSAIFGAVAAGEENGGWGDVFSAARAMGSPVERTYFPEPKAAAVYQRLYEEYTALHDYFGRGGSRVMHRLKGLKTGN